MTADELERRIEDISRGYATPDSRLLYYLTKLCIEILRKLEKLEKAK